MSIHILALHNVRTGGPEATHQLSDALIEQGFDARLVYYDFRQIALMEGRGPSDDGYVFGARENKIEEYAGFRTNVADSVPNAPGHIVVLPETLAHLAPFFNKSIVLIWWLSVDNGFGALSRVNLNHLRKPGVWHAHQSQYAAGFCEALGFRIIGPLSDYTTDLSQYVKPLPMSERPKLVVFNANPHKIIADISAIIREIKEIDPEIECEIVHGSRADVAALFARARVYVDLGSFPGKDRMPREAALMGCPSLSMSSVGASSEACSFLLQQQPLTAADIVATMTRTRPWQPHIVSGERQTFHREVRDIFSALAQDEPRN